MEEYRIITKANGKKYTIRNDRNRFFYPDEWKKFINVAKPSKKYLFIALLQSGARIAEILEIKPLDFDFERYTLTLRVTKIKSKKNEKVGKKRTFKVSKEFILATKKYIRDNKIKPEEKMFNVHKNTVYQLFMRYLEKAELDPKEFGLHNIRKTCGNWLKALGVPPDEICLRLGHDYNTYLKHYGSANIFDLSDKRLMIKILGDIYS